MVQVFSLNTNDVSDSTQQSIEDLVKCEPCIIDSLGFLVLENDDYVIISNDKNSKNEDDLFVRSQAIPKDIIKKIKYLH